MDPESTNKEIDAALREFEAQKSQTPKPTPQVATPPTPTPIAIPTPPSPTQGINEIDLALKEFEAKSQTQAPVAAAEPDAVSLSPETPKMVGKLIKYSGGAIKSQRQAEIILLGFVIIAMGISFYLFFGGGGGSQDINLNPDIIDPGAI